MINETDRGGDMTFPVEVKTYHEVWESELSRFVSAYYNQPWRMQQGEMLGQYTYRELEVGPEGPEYGDPKEARKALAAWLALKPPQGAGVDTPAWYQWQTNVERNHYVSVDTIMWDLCRKGVIPAGIYLIKVWW